ncbi:hypothetical protein [Aerosakkonema funiforme]|uniref:hypothetical protein n=1 Tax=Aerosakkonema funiforme TaxID=1246630 RepID=UPI0035B91AFF
MKKIPNRSTPFKPNVEEFVSNFTYVLLEQENPLDLKPDLFGNEFILNAKSASNQPYPK